MKKGQKIETEDDEPTDAELRKDFIDLIALCDFKLRDGENNTLDLSVIDESGIAKAGDPIEFFGISGTVKEILPKDENGETPIIAIFSAKLLRDTLRAIFPDITDSEISKSGERFLRLPKKDKKQETKNPKDKS